MERSRWTGAAVVAIAVVIAGCGSEDSTATRPAPSSAAPSSPAPSATEDAPPVLMPDLIGLGSEVAFPRIARLGERSGLDLGVTWGRQVLVDCAVRPGTVAGQRPRAGTPLERRTEMVIRTAAMDLAAYRGPCEPEAGDLGPVTGPDAQLARAFYRFAADPTLGAPFADGALWVGIEGGPTSVRLDASERDDLAAWELDTDYAERSGPFSALDVVASSGGYFELHAGIPGCAGTTADVPAELAGLRPLTLTPPADTVGACLQWWGVTLFLDDHDLIRGVALRLGSP